MTADPTLPPPMFDVTETGDLTPPIFELRPGDYSVALTPFGRHYGLGPSHGFGPPFCDQAHYDSIDSLGRRVWIYHLCSRTSPHDNHTCDRCDHTWSTP